MVISMKQIGTKKVLMLLTLTLFSQISLFGMLEKPLYDNSYNKYTFANWKTIKKDLNDKILDGDNGTAIINRLRHASYLLVRLSRMKLNQKQCDLVRYYLVKYFQDYIHISRFIEYMESKKRKEYNKNGYPLKDGRIVRLSKYKRTDYWLLYYPLQILRTIAVLSPSLGEINFCSNEIDNLKDKNEIKEFKVNFAYMLFRYNKKDTDIQYMKSILKKYRQKNYEHSIKIAILIRQKGIEETYQLQYDEFLVNYKNNTFYDKNKTPMDFSNAFGFRNFNITFDFFNKCYNNAKNEYQKYFVIIALFRGYVYSVKNTRNNVDLKNYKAVYNMINTFLKTPARSSKNKILYKQVKSVFDYSLEIDLKKIK